MLIICDIDGTIADCSHRVPLIPDWDAFNGLMAEDEPILPVVNLILRAAIPPATEAVMSAYPFLCNPPRRLAFLTGRPERYRPVTARWLLDHCNLAEHDDYDLIMRPDENYDSDVDLKPYLLGMSTEPGGVLHDWAVRHELELDEDFMKSQAIFIDDRDRVVAMWRGKGYTCLQPQEGAY